MKTDTDYNRWWKIMNYPLKFIPISDLKWAAKQPYNSLTSKNFFLAEIERRKKMIKSECENCAFLNDEWCSFYEIDAPLFGTCYNW